MKVGDKVCYIPFEGAHPIYCQKGMIKGFVDNSNAFVVYNCGHDWDNYTQYTGANTPISKLVLGWE